MTRQEWPLEVGPAGLLKLVIIALSTFVSQKRIALRVLRGSEAVIHHVLHHELISLNLTRLKRWSFPTTRLSGPSNRSLTRNSQMTTAYVCFLCSPYLTRISLSAVPSKEFPWKDRPSFEALSYEWGPAEPTYPIIVDQEYGLRIRRNLFYYLQLTGRRAPGHENELYVVWIDALCMNQNDLTERSRQVQRMHLLYSSASRVILFLGLNKDGIHETFTAITEIGQYFVDNHRQQQSALLQSFSSSGSEPNIEFVQPVPSDEVFARAGRLWTFSYFTRMWIFQEVVSAKLAFLFCGDWELPWRTVDLYLQADSLVTRQNSRGLRHASYEGISPHALSDTRIAMRLGSRMWPRTRLDLIYMLQATRQLHATEAHDKIFALLNITTSPALPTLQPDYNEPWQTLYTRTTRFLIENSGLLDVLEDVEISGKTPELPSWVPNWQSYPVVRSGFEAVDYMLCCADGGMGTKVRDLGDPRLLGLQGLRVGVIHTVSQPIQSISGPTQTFEQLHDRFKEEMALVNTSANDSETTYLQTKELLNLAYTRTKFCDSFPQRLINPASEFNDVANGLTPWPDILRQLSSTESASVPEDIQLSLREQASNKAFFTTTKGGMGMSPTAAMILPGDVVYVFLGGWFPVVLRPSSAGGQGTFTFVCLCYLHGFMHGEAVGRPRADEGGPTATFIGQHRGKQPDLDERIAAVTGLESVILV